jgi:hypothetical protein
MKGSIVQVALVMIMVVMMMMPTLTKAQDKEVVWEGSWGQFWSQLEGCFCYICCCYSCRD